jgi:hypothetical protein
MCNILSRREIERAVERLLEAGSRQRVVPARVSHSLSVHGRCRGCFPEVVGIGGEVTGRVRARLPRESAAPMD